LRGHAAVRARSLRRLKCADVRDDGFEVSSGFSGADGSWGGGCDRHQSGVEGDGELGVVRADAAVRARSLRRLKCADVRDDGFEMGSGLSSADGSWGGGCDRHQLVVVRSDAAVRARSLRRLKCADVRDDGFEVGSGVSK
jgi:hypothetical protein